MKYWNLSTEVSNETSSHAITISIQYYAGSSKGREIKQENYNVVLIS